MVALYLATSFACNEEMRNVTELLLDINTNQPKITYFIFINFLICQEYPRQVPVQADARRPAADQAGAGEHRSERLGLHQDPVRRPETAQVVLGREVPHSSGEDRRVQVRQQRLLLMLKVMFMMMMMMMLRPQKKICYVALTRPKSENWVGRSIFFFFYVPWESWVFQYFF